MENPEDVEEVAELLRGVIFTFTGFFLFICLHHLHQDFTICKNRHDLDISIFKVRITCLEKRLVTRALSKVLASIFIFSNPVILHLLLIALLELHSFF